MFNRASRTRPIPWPCCPVLQEGSGPTSYFGTIGVPTHRASTSAPLGRPAKQELVDGGVDAVLAQTLGHSEDALGMLIGVVAARNEDHNRLQSLGFGHLPPLYRRPRTSVVREDSWDSELAKGVRLRLAVRTHENLPLEEPLVSRTATSRRRPERSTSTQCWTICLVGGDGAELVDSRGF